MLIRYIHSLLNFYLLNSYSFFSLLSASFASWFLIYIICSSDNSFVFMDFAYSFILLKNGNLSLVFKFGMENF